MQIINNIHFDNISLEEMEHVKLMNRTDTKYWFHVNQLQALLECIKSNYFALNVNSEKWMPYTTTYYDTASHGMYKIHHNGKLNRYKIRKRTYLLSGDCYFELKLKTNKGQTVKKRFLTDNKATEFSTIEKEFIETNSPYIASELYPSLTNDFLRLMLVSKELNERCTIDINLSFSNKNKFLRLENLAVLEIKSAINPANQKLLKTLKYKRIKISGFSKYCIGLALINDRVKRNAFKPKLRAMEKELAIKLISL